MPAHSVRSLRRSIAPAWMTDVQRTFSGFPAGWAGVALLLLRVVVGASGAIEAGFNFTGAHVAVSVTTIAAVCVANASLAVIIGFLTPLAGTLLCGAGMATMLMRIPSDALVLLDSRMATFEFVVMSAVLTILGPGMISVDARLFGRREIVVGEARRPNDF